MSLDRDSEIWKQVGSCHLGGIPEPRERWGGVGRNQITRTLCHGQSVYFIEGGRGRKLKKEERKKNHLSFYFLNFVCFFFKLFCDVVAFFHIAVLRQPAVPYATVPRFNSLSPHAIPVILRVPVLQRWHRGSLRKLLSSQGTHSCTQV